MIITTTVINCVVVSIKVPSVDIVDKPIAVVVDAIDGIEGIGPNICIEIRVLEINTFVDNTDINRARACVARAPGLCGLTTKCVSWRTGITVHSPKRSIDKVRIVRVCLMRINPVRLCVFNHGVSLQHSECTAHIRRDLQEFEATVSGSAHGIGL